MIKSLLKTHFRAG